MDIFGQLAKKIIEEQESIIGPVALEEAKKVSGLSVDLKNNTVQLTGNKTTILENLVEKYQELFGQTSVEACKEAVKGIIGEVPREQVPILLR